MVTGNTLEWRLQRAADARKEGYNCAQSVLLALPEVTGLSDDDIKRLSMALGAGVAGTGEICGVVNALAMLEGFLHGPEASEKGATSRMARELAEAFRASNGSLICRELKGKPNVRPCNDLIAEGIRMFHDRLGR